MENRLVKAIQFATLFHQGQFRKTEQNGVIIPFVVHPIEVMKKLWNWGTVNEDMMCAAVLHDTIEDSSLTFWTIKQEFGDNVAELVLRLTNDNPETKAKELYLKGFANACIRPLIIKIADRICNVNDYAITNKPYAAKYAKKAGVLWEALTNRKAEIIGSFGEQAYQNIIKDVLAMWENLE